jgi:cation diffusion facilitator family transporter
LRAAYLHVLADALTSLLAIAALLAGKYVGAAWLDPAMGIVGAVLVARWSWGLIGDTLRVLLDRQVADGPAAALTRAVEQGTTDRVVDLHCWSIGHQRYAAELVVVSDTPRPPEYYKARIPPELNVVHVTVEVHRCAVHEAIVASGKIAPRNGQV